MSGAGFAKVDINGDALLPGARADAYARGIDHTLDTAFLTPAIAFDFRSCHVGPIRVIELDASPRRSSRLAGQIDVDRYDGISVQLALAGTSRGTARGAPVVHAPNTIMLLDFAQPFVMTDDEPRTVINLAFPRHMLSLHLDAAALHGVVLDSDAALFMAAYVALLVPRLETLPRAGSVSIVRLLVAHLLSALGVHTVNPILAPVDQMAMLRDRARELILGRIGSSQLSPQWLIDRMGVSRTELYRALQGSGGISRYIWQLRLEAAHQLLTDPNERRGVGDIAEACGFATSAHFARLFRERYEVSASEARRQTRP